MAYLNRSYLDSLCSKIPESEPADSDARCIIHIVRDCFPPEIISSTNNFLSHKPTLQEVTQWFKENIPDSTAIFAKYKCKNVFSATVQLIYNYDAALPHHLLPPCNEANFVTKLFFQHYSKYSYYLDNSPKKTHAFYQLLLTIPHYHTVVEWCKNNISDWSSEYRKYQAFFEMFAVTDNFIENFAATVCKKSTAGSDAHKIVFLYRHFRNLCDGFLSYSSTVHESFYQLVQTKPNEAQVVQWFKTNMHEWNSTKYGLTNGHIDWYTGGCFADTTNILMADGKTKGIQYLRRGDMVMSGEEKARVVCVLQWLMPMECVTVGDLVITPWHPIRVAGEWVFPYHKTENVEGVKRAVYNLVLDSGHVVTADGIEACTLGHGFTDNDVIQHAFYGTSAVIEELQRIDPEGWQKGMVRGSGVMMEDGMIVGLV